MISSELIAAFAKEAKYDGSMLAQRFSAGKSGVPSGVIAHGARLQKLHVRGGGSVSEAVQLFKDHIAPHLPTVKRGDDPALALLPKVKGLKMPRKATPRLPGASTKGEIPVNPFSGNWVKPASLQAAGKHLKGVGQAAGGLALLAGGAHLANESRKALKNPYGQQGRQDQTRGELQAIRKARIVHSGLSAAPGLLGAS